MQDKRPLFALVAIVAIVAGVAYFMNGDDGGTSTAPTGGSTAPVTLADGTPAAEPSAEEFKRQVERLTAAENALFKAPDPTKVDEIMTANCQCYTDTRTRVTALKDKKYSFDGDNLNLLTASYLRGGGTTMEGAVRLAPGKGKVVDDNGKVIEPAASGDYQPLVYTLERGPDGVWRIAGRSVPEEIVPL